MEEYIQEFERKLAGLLASVRGEFATVRANRPSPQLLEQVKVEYGGKVLLLRQLGTIGVQPPRDLIVTVWDKSLAAAVAKAIEQAPLGFTPNVDGSVIRMQLPPLTDERRRELTRLVKGMAEQGRIKMRILRDEAMKRIKRGTDAKEISENQAFTFKERAQKAVDKTNGEIETILAQKVKEINE